MLSQRFLRWKDTADVNSRAAAASALGRAYLQCEMEFEDRCGAEAAMTLLLDDASPKVRYALAEAIGSSIHAPEHVIAALSRDQFEIAALVIARSPILRDRDLQDIVSICEPRLQALIAHRPEVSNGLAKVISRQGDRDAALALLDNFNAHLCEECRALLAERFEGDASVRNRLLSRGDLEIEVRYRLTRASALGLASMPLIAVVSGKERSERICREELARNLVHLLDITGEDDTSALIDAMREEGDLTSTLLIRAVCHGKMDFFSHVLADLSGQDLRRVTGILVQERASQLLALLTQAGLSDAVQPVFVKAVSLWRAVAQQRLSAGSQEITHMVIRHMEEVRQASKDHANDDILALLRSIYLDTMRENARLHAQDLVRPPALPEPELAIPEVQSDLPLLVQAA